VVIGEGNVKKLKKLPNGCRMGDNANALFGGFRLWEKTDLHRGSMAARTRSASLSKHKWNKEDDQKKRSAP
jgi:polyphosphate glucokinase